MKKVSSNNNVPCTNGRTRLSRTCCESGRIRASLSLSIFLSFFLSLTACEPYLPVSIIFSFLLRSTITCRVCHAAIPKRPRSAKRDFAGRPSVERCSHTYQPSPRAFLPFSRYSRCRAQGGCNSVRYSFHGRSRCAQS